MRLLRSPCCYFSQEEAQEEDANMAKGMLSHLRLRDTICSTRD
ncbi:hypothetical protein [Coriobacterium glomerans]|nr:hypothetical protein [Coriobacterium glomerans]